MSHYDDLQKLRDTIHKDIVQEATVRNAILNNDSDGIIVLSKPLLFEYYTVAAVCCNTGLLLSRDLDKIVPYRLLTIEELAQIHRVVVDCKNYSFTLNPEYV